MSDKVKIRIWSYVPNNGHAHYRHKARPSTARGSWNGRHDPTYTHYQWRYVIVCGSHIVYASQGFCFWDRAWRSLNSTGYSHLRAFQRACSKGRTDQHE